MKRLSAAIAMGFGLALTCAAYATSHQSAAAGYATGEVRKVDKEAGKVTLKHGPIANLEMPPMTMVFRVKQPSMLEKVKAGDKVKFKAENVQGTYTVTEITAAAGK
jgi:Cu(I)/Ag(I) efflux system protein CusF